MKHTYIIIFLAALLAVSCSKEKEMQNEFVDTTYDLGLTIGGTAIFSYDAATCQYAYIPAQHEFRICDDNMSDYVILTLEKEPAEGVECGGSITYTTKTDIVQTSGLKFKVIKEDSAGKFWIWNKSKKMGVVVKKIQ